jgi:hypothetical protein
MRWGRGLEAEAGDGLECSAVGRRRTHGPDGTVLHERCNRKVEPEGILAAGVEFCPGVDSGVVLRQEDAYIVDAATKVALAQNRSFCRAERGEQQQDAGEMEGAKSH